MRSIFIAAILALLPISVQAETFEVKMLNGNATGGMAFEPDFLSLKPGRHGEVFGDATRS